MKTNKSKNNEEHTFLSAHHVAEEMNELIKEGGKWTDSEYFETNAYSKTLKERLGSKSHHQYLYDQLSKEEKEENIKKLILRAQKLKQRRVLVTRFITLTSLAAAMLAISFLLYPTKSKQEKNEVYISNSTDPHIYSEPTIILETGENISLCGKNIDIDHSKYSIEKVDGEKLKYNAVNRDSSEKYNKLVVPSGFLYTIILSDGSEVIINAGSNLIYPTQFTKNSRVVELQGEAYFKVTKSDKPFIVKTLEGEVKVYGTEFNVFCGIKGEMEAVLVEGSIGLTCSDTEEIMMAPNEHAIFKNLTSNITVEQVNVANYTAWRDKRFVFKGQSLKRVFYDISTWYGVKITTAVEVDDIKITMVQDRDKDINYILDFISEITGLKFIEEGKGVYNIER